MPPTESIASCNAVRILTHEEFTAKHPHPPSPGKMPKIDVARLNALKAKPKPSENLPETVMTPSDDGEDPMEEDRVPTGRTLRRKKEKVAKHLKRGANEKEKEYFRKRVFRIPIDKPFEEAYYTHRLWMFFRETREKEEDIKIMFSKHPHPPSPGKVRIARRADTSIDPHGECTIARQTKAIIDRQPPAPSIDEHLLPTECRCQR
ncbi:hypothetical protein F2Q69_00022153 [Brassica cretica]|uniref:Uncharacterized protein n=1 Tax=Brassica cretica TaxID=69181 RepID=A0A8S9QR97_BRACR|nr:hypothetical protein F2Q69_00022153 [Brassica cretica]